MHANSYQTATFTKKKKKCNNTVHFSSPFLFFVGFVGFFFFFAQKFIYNVYNNMLHDGTMEKCTTDAWKGTPPPIKIKVGVVKNNSSGFFFERRKTGSDVSGVRCCCCCFVGT
ncbi:UNVERIFIED_CONTAM: hypothetical protein K2H54_045206 [Gekko kuhli]